MPRWRELAASDSHGCAQPLLAQSSVFSNHHLLCIATIIKAAPKKPRARAPLAHGCTPNAAEVFSCFLISGRRLGLGLASRCIVLEKRTVLGAAVSFLYEQPPRPGLSQRQWSKCSGIPLSCPRPGRPARAGSHSCSSSYHGVMQVGGCRGFQASVKMAPLCVSVRCMCRHCPAPAPMRSLLAAVPSSHNVVWPLAASFFPICLLSSLL